ncbi:MAG: cytochrome c oxidase subunit II [Bdellovibrionales bacterium]|nr:cytochrome c oxidase subunit II [Bdellovibrionales bacterium]
MGFILKFLTNSAYAFNGHLPIQATEVAKSWDDLWWFLVWLSVFFFILCVGGMIYFALKYKGKPGVKPTYITGNVPIEIVWTAVPFVLLMAIFVWGWVVYVDMTRPPTDAYEIRVVGKQWLWQFQYDDGRTTVNELYVPVNKPVKLTMTSTDVLHSFFVPNFRVKSDVVPGMFTNVWFEATVPGKHQVFCTEYCGTSHSLMLAKVIALNPQDWEAWKAGKKIPDQPNADPVQDQQIAKDVKPATSVVSTR